MIALTLAEVAALAGGTVTGSTVTGVPDASARGSLVVDGPVIIDSRRAEPGALFAAVAGERVDGHEFGAAAVRGGAVAVLAARPLDGVPCVVVPDVQAALGRLARGVLDRLVPGGLAVAAITGSSGKTSTKDLTAQVVERSGPTVAPEGSLNNELGVPLTVLRATYGTRYLVLEMAARGPGHIGFLCDVAPPRIGAVLNVGRAHAGEFGSLETVAKAKGELIEALPAAAAGGVAILNADDPRVLAMAERTDARVVTYSMAGAYPGGRPPGAPRGAGPRQAGTGGRVARRAGGLAGGSGEVVSDGVKGVAGGRRGLLADVRAAEIVLDDLGRAAFRLLMPGGMAPVRLRLHGAHHVSNALAAAAIAAELGMEVPDIAEALSSATARSGKRMDVSERADGVLVVNDAYNANPDSMRAGIEALGHMISRGRRGVAVLGYMAELGGIAAESHVTAGRLAARAGASLVVGVGESAADIVAGASAVEEWGGTAIAVPDAASAVAALRNQLHGNDVVLVKASKAAGLWEVADGLLAEVDR